ncbi:MAG: hypothetical protein H6716_29035 [Polyangiaceae bacterium]|nr:hypothetical protein [Polyangiaceae bacterium]
MGHKRHGRLPRTYRWSEVMALMGAGGEFAAMAAEATLDAVEEEMDAASLDPGVVRSVHLLTLLPEAASTEGFVGALRDLDLDVSDAPSALELVGAVSEALDRHLDRSRSRTDLGEMAALAAVESLTSALLARTEGLFESTAEDVQRELQLLGTVKNFAGLARDFFGRLTARHLAYYVDREVPVLTGSNQPFRHLADGEQYSKLIGQHAYEAARTVQDFAGGWRSKALYENDQLTEDHTRKFVSYAFVKMREELRRGV